MRPHLRYDEEQAADLYYRLTDLEEQWRVL